MALWSTWNIDASQEACEQADEKGGLVDNRYFVGSVAKLTTGKKDVGTVRISGNATCHGGSCRAAVPFSVTESDRFQTYSDLVCDRCGLRIGLRLKRCPENGTTIFIAVYAATRDAGGPQRFPTVAVSKVTEESSATKEQPGTKEALIGCIGLLVIVGGIGFVAYWLFFR